MTISKLSEPGFASVHEGKLICTVRGTELAKCQSRKCAYNYATRHTRFRRTPRTAKTVHISSGECVYKPSFVAALGRLAAIYLGGLLPAPTSGLPGRLKPGQLVSTYYPRPLCGEVRS